MRFITLCFRHKAGLAAPWKSPSRFVLIKYLLLSCALQVLRPFSTKPFLYKVWKNILFKTTPKVNRFVNVPVRYKPSILQVQRRIIFFGSQADDFLLTRSVTSPRSCCVSSDGSASTRAVRSLIPLICCHVRKCLYYMWITLSWAGITKSPVYY